MTCDVFQNRLLALPDLNRPTDELRRHLATCDACSLWLARARQLDASLAAMPVPSSSGAKAAFLDSITRAGPVITSIPRLDRPAGVTFFRRVDWRVVSGLAAAALVGVGVWFGSGPGKTVAEVAGPKHALLGKGVDFVAAMSTARTPQERTRVSMTMAGDLRDEVKVLYASAKPEDLDKLAEMYEKVVDRGLLSQAAQLDRVGVSAKDRRELWTQLGSHFTEVARDAAVMATTAPAPAVPAVARLGRAAVRGQTKLEEIVAAAGGAP